ncbi:CLUMA_CG002986, isoform A [Clunio marinus]|uniref:CLUMA_CG002986, isoform A n=1 Tax=Clunio marinus TaxID=568069 RepID=A0A1J1HMQ9_9DIPT|nr:CLUMA_CG002986, isoform A [Clunio marinus]
MNIHVEAVLVYYQEPLCSCREFSFSSKQWENLCKVEDYAIEEKFKNYLTESLSGIEFRSPTLVNLSMFSNSAVGLRSQYKSLHRFSFSFSVVIMEMLIRLDTSIALSSHFNDLNLLPD